MWDAAQSKRMNAESYQQGVELRGLVDLDPDAAREIAIKPDFQTMCKFSRIFPKRLRRANLQSYSTPPYQLLTMQ